MAGWLSMNWWTRSGTGFPAAGSGGLCLQEGQELLGRPAGEPFNGQTQDIGVLATRQLELHRQGAAPGVLVVNFRIAGRVGKADDRRDRLPLEMRRPAECAGLPRSP